MNGWVPVIIAPILPGMNASFVTLRAHIYENTILEILHNLLSYELVLEQMPVGQVTISEYRTLGISRCYMELGRWNT